MKKLLMLTAVFVILFTGCGDEKPYTDDIGSQQTVQPSITTSEEGTVQAPVAADPTGLSPEEQKASAEETKQELQTLRDVLKGLEDEDFSDVDLTE